MMSGIKKMLFDGAKALAFKLGLGLIVFLILLAGWAWVKALEADVERLEAVNRQLLASAAEADQKLQAARAETAGLARELERSYQALEAREAEKKRLEAEKEAQKAEICEVYKNEQTANTWVNTAVPGSVVGRLCKPVRVPAGQAAPGGLPSGCAGASVKNRDLVNWILDLQEALRQSNSDKAALRDWVAEIISP